MILVTGAAGYIGSALVQRFGNNAAIGVDNFIKPRKDRPVDIIDADICDKATMEDIIVRYGITSIINLAAVVGDPACVKYPKQAVMSNLEGVESLLTAAKRAGTVTKFVQASTCSVYGFNEQMVDEDSAVNPLSLYAETKVKAEQLVRDSGLQYAVLRFATACGWSPAPRFDLTVNEFTRDVYYDRMIEVYSKNDWRPYCDVVDLVYVLYMAAVKSSVMGVYNVGAQKNNFTKGMILDMLSKYKEVCYCETIDNKDPRNYKVNFDHIKRALPEVNFTSLDDTVLEIMAKLKEGGIDADDSVYRADHLNC